MESQPDNPLPPRGHVARVNVTAQIEYWPPPRAHTLPPGVFVAADGVLILSHGAHASCLRLESAEDAARLAYALLAVADGMHEAAARAVAAADMGIARVLAEREAAGNA